MGKLTWRTFFSARAAGRPVEHMYSVVAGAGANTNIPVAGATMKDGLICVLEFLDPGEAAAPPVIDRTATSSFTSDGNLQCTAATNTTANRRLLVIWAKR